MRAKTISSAAELLAILGENRTRRAVGDARKSSDGDLYPAAIEYPTDAPRGVGRFLGWIKAGSEAGMLLDAAYRADVGYDPPAWAALPLRYGPYCSTWVLPSHPKASAKCGGDTPSF